MAVTHPSPILGQAPWESDVFKLLNRARIWKNYKHPCSPNNSLTAAGRVHFPVIWMPPSYFSKMRYPTFSSFSCFFIPEEWLVFDVGNTKSGVDAMSEEAWRISGQSRSWKLVTFASPSRRFMGTIGNILPGSHGSNQIKPQSIGVAFETVQAVLGEWVSSFCYRSHVCTSSLGGAQTCFPFDWLPFNMGKCPCINRWSPAWLRSIELL